MILQTLKLCSFLVRESAEPVASIAPSQTKQRMMQDVFSAAGKKKKEKGKTYFIAIFSRGCGARKSITLEKATWGKFIENCYPVWH